MSSMKKSDLLSMAVQNLKNRKSRTKLTVIGVIIGTCSIVIMVSIGVGINNTITSMFSTSSVAQISVTSQNIFDTIDDEEKKHSPLDDSAVAYLNSIESVEQVVPIIKLNDGVVVTRGKYSMLNPTIIGIDFDNLEKYGLKFKEGEKSNSTYENIAYFGDTAVTGFTDRQGNPVKYKFDKDYHLSECEINPMTDTFYIGVVDNSNVEQNHTNNIPQEKLRVEGVVTADTNKGLDVSNAIYVDIDYAKKLINEYNRITKGEKKSTEYTEICVYIDDIDNIESVQSKITAVGLLGFSDQNALEGTKKIMLAVQLVLGAIGAVSMFVAAFGISNTMVMAVYERTKEIGVMKVIGCDIKDIKALFLYEAGIIGLIGGAVGVAISCIVSLIANLVAMAAMSSMSGGEDISITVSSVPWWLALLGIGFSTGIGVLSGLSPASRAVKVSALKAIHNE